MVAAAVLIVAVIIAGWCLLAGFKMYRTGITLNQALLYAPLAALYRITDKDINVARETPAPVIYAVWHSSRLEPALMLSLLPPNTLHILDEDSARAWWLDPWRALARTIVFNARHVFVSRRLVRRLRGGGRLAVYLPDETAPDQKTFRLFRAISRIAVNSGATIVPIQVKGAERSLFALDRSSRRSLFPKLEIRTLPSKTIAELVELDPAEKSMAATVMFNHLLAVRGVQEPQETGPATDTAA